MSGSKLSIRKSIFLYILISVLLLTGCGYTRYKNNKPDDAISKAIYEELGDAVYYIGKIDNPHMELGYRYLIREEKPDLVYNIAVKVNEIIGQEEITDKVDIILYFEIPGALGVAVQLSNYSDGEMTEPDYEGLQKLVINGNEEEGNDYLYNDPSIYTTIPNIKSLEIREEIQERAEAEGIDWYECWPELEEIEIH